MDDRLELDMEVIKSRLDSQRAELLRLMEATAGEEEPEVDKTRSGRLTRMDELRSQAMSVETERRRKLELARIDAALRRLEEGDYGFCTVCGDPIASGRIGVDPSVEQCIHCATSAEMSGREVRR
jgi:DnaK suppressor protein